MRIRLTVAASLLAGLVAVSCRSPRPAGGGSAVKDDETLPDQGSAPAAADPNDPLDNRSARGGLRGTADTPDGLVPFRISGDYPASPGFLTAPPPEPRFTRDAASGARTMTPEAASEWLRAMQAYIYADMNDQNPTDQNRNFRVGGGRTEISRKRWYHMPWLHTPKGTPTKPGRGRDASWGLTRELDLKGPITNWPINTGTSCIGYDWGIGFFNEPGGYAIGQVFPPGRDVRPEKADFPVGTVSFKMLFTSANPSNLAAIQDSWTIDAKVPGLGCPSADKRAPNKLWHIQMDVMMKYGPGREDWIFGVYIYNRNKRTEFWQGMEPIGTQWGVAKNQTMVVSTELKPNGFEGRLNGPADNPMSSCYSCHARAQWPEVSTGRLPFAPRNAADAKNICLLHNWDGEGRPGCPTCPPGGACIPAGVSPVVPGNASMHYSLQFALALRNRAAALGGE